MSVEITGSKYFIGSEMNNIITVCLIVFKAKYAYCVRNYQNKKFHDKSLLKRSTTKQNINKTPTGINFRSVINYTKLSHFTFLFLGVVFIFFSTSGFVYIDADFPKSDNVFSYSTDNHGIQDINDTLEDIKNPFAAKTTVDGEKDEPIGPDQKTGINENDNQLTLKLFINKLINGNQKQVVGVFVENKIALPVVQQPINDPAYVSPIFGEVTEFSQAREYTGNIGLVAHNYLSGIDFYKLEPGDKVQVIYGNGVNQEYTIIRSEGFQALTPDSSTSNFVDLKSGETLSAKNLFYHVFEGKNRLVFEVCIAKGEIGNWGRMFILAEKQ